MPNTDPQPPNLPYSTDSCQSVHRLVYRGCSLRVSLSPPYTVTGSLPAGPNTEQTPYANDGVHLLYVVEYRQLLSIRANMPCNPLPWPPECAGQPWTVRTWNTDDGVRRWTLTNNDRLLIVGDV